MLQIYNTFTQKKEIFKPQVAGEIRFMSVGSRFMITVI